MPGTYISPAETALYYLQSRYYDPNLGRFLNADAFAATGQGLLGNNMFAYCNNSPVLLTDSEGTRPVVGASPNKETADERQASFDYMNGNRNALPYSTADDAARAFSEEVLTSSIYIQHEYGTEIYARTTIKGTTYYYNPPRAGSPHSVVVGLSVPSGTTMVAYAHTHPASPDFGFSQEDIRVAYNLGVSAYVVGPNLELMRFDLASPDPIPLGSITPMALTNAHRTNLEMEFQDSWTSHVSDMCQFNCSRKIWPVQ